MRPRFALYPNKKSIFAVKPERNYSYSSDRFKPEIYHATHFKDGTIRILHICNNLLALYAGRRGSVSARKLFDEITERDVKTWTVLISGLSRCENHVVALYYFIEMQKEGIGFPNAFTLSSLLKCCASVESGLPLGKAIHCFIIRNKIVVDVPLENALLDLYAKCEIYHYVKQLFELMENKDSISWNIMMTADINRGDMEESLDLFWRLPIKTVSNWNTIIDGLLRRGCQRNALELLYEMVRAGLPFDNVTFSVSLVLSTSLRSLELGKQIHCHLLRSGIHEDSFVRTSLLDMYCKCSQMGKASMIFQAISKGSSDSMAETVSRSAMVAGYVQNGMIKEALQCFSSMIRDQLNMNLFTLTSIVTASSHASLLELGQQIHALTLKSGDSQDIVLCSSLIDMYAKCGKLDNARSLFEQTQSKNVVLWSAMISSYAIHGFGVEAIQLFESMRNKGIRPNEVSYLAVLSGCSHSGLVQDGCKYFKMMMEINGIQPGIEHFAAMVDLFGRAGHLKETKDFVYGNGIQHVREVWKTFLSSCWVHKNVEMTNWISGKLVQLEAHGTDSCLLISNTYSANQVWDEAARFRGQILEREITKSPGQSWICS